MSESSRNAFQSTTARTWVLVLCATLAVGVGCAQDNVDSEVADNGTVPDGGRSPDGGAMPDGGGAVFEGCSEARFVLNPGGPSPTNVPKDVCFHSNGEIGLEPGECPVVNYTIRPHDSFDEFVDIFYGGRMCEDQFLAEYPDGSDVFIFSGQPLREPGTTGTEPLATGTYFVLGGNQRGDFEYYWPTP